MAAAVVLQFFRERSRTGQIGGALQIAGAIFRSHGQCWRAIDVENSPLPAPLGGSVILMSRAPFRPNGRGGRSPGKGDAVVSVIPIIIYAAELALAAIILYYVVELLAMAGNMKRSSRC